MKNTAIKILLAIVLLNGLSFSQSSEGGIVIQGVLRNQANSAVPDGAYSLTFAIYTQKEGGTALWTSPQQTIEVKNGVFSSVLGGFSADVTFSTQYFAGITVSGMGGELNPRIELTAAAYAFGIVGGENKVGGDGNVGIGSLQPTEKLEVAGNLKISGFLESGDSLSLKSKIRFKQGSGGLFDDYDKPIVQQQYTTQKGDALIFKPGGSSNSLHSITISENNGVEVAENTPVIVINSESGKGVQFGSSFSSALSGENFYISRGGDNTTKNSLVMQIDNSGGSKFEFTAGEDMTHLTIDGATGNLGLGKIPAADAKLDVDGSIFVNGLLPFDYKEFQGFGITIDINTNYDANEWIGLFAGHNPNTFDVDEHANSGIRQYCYVKNGKIWVKSRLPGHITNMSHKVYVMFVRKEIISGVMPTQ